VYTAPSSYKYKQGYDNSTIVYDYTAEMVAQATGATKTLAS
jgi:hypothetical protein